MDLKQIKSIIDLMKRSDLTEFAVEEEGFKLKIRRGVTEAPDIAISRKTAALTSEIAREMDVDSTGDSNGSRQHEVQDTNSEEPTEQGIAYIKSPMVGTFYRAASPDSSPFVDVDSKVSESTVVCIIEAMKIMNEIQADYKGTILEVLVENGQPVEYGQKLFKLKQG